MTLDSETTPQSVEKIFLPSPNTILLPGGLCICGILLLFFFQFGQQGHNTETIILGWGFIIMGILGVFFGRKTSRRYRVLVTEKKFQYIPAHEMQESLEIPLDTLQTVQLQQSFVARFFRYGSLLIKSNQTELFLPDIDRPEELQALLAPHLPTQE